jgi:hypothetical protein
MAANGISTLSTKQARQVAKLNAAQAKRQAGGNTNFTAYRSLNIYNINNLPAKFLNNGVVDNPGPLLPGRPWA